MLGSVCAAGDGGGRSVSGHVGSDVEGLEG